MSGVPGPGGDAERGAAPSRSGEETLSNLARVRRKKRTKAMRYLLRHPLVRWKRRRQQSLCQGGTGVLRPGVKTVSALSIKNSRCAVHLLRLESLHRERDDEFQHLADVVPKCRRLLREPGGQDANGGADKEPAVNKILYNLWKFEL